MTIAGTVALVVFLIWLYVGSSPNDESDQFVDPTRFRR